MGGGHESLTRDEEQWSSTRLGRLGWRERGNPKTEMEGVEERNEPERERDSPFLSPPPDGD